MRFLVLLENLKKSNESRTRLTENGTALIGTQLSPPPLAEHYIFPPMSTNVMQHLIDSYKRTIPKELLTLYRAANGMNLFWTKGYLSNGLKFPFSGIDIFGMPMGSLRSCLQPYDISIEDSSRPNGTPDCFLKFGCYSTKEDSTCTAEYDLFVDTENSTVCSSNRNSKEFHEEERWNSIDDCLCSLFERMSYNT